MRHDPDDHAPFGCFAPSAAIRRLLEFAQRSPRNAFGKQLAHAARSLYLWRAPSPVDVTVGDVRLRCYLRENTCERKFVFTPWRFDPLELAAMAESLPRRRRVRRRRRECRHLHADRRAAARRARQDRRARTLSARVSAAAVQHRRHARGAHRLAAHRRAASWASRIARNRSELHIDGGNLGGGSIARDRRASRAAAPRIRDHPLQAAAADAG